MRENGRDRNQLTRCANQRTAVPWAIGQRAEWFTEHDGLSPSAPRAPSVRASSRPSPSLLQGGVEGDLEFFDRLLQARSVVGFREEPGFAVVLLAENTQIVQILRQRLVERAVVIYPVSVVRGCLLGEKQASHRRMPDKIVRDAARVEDLRDSRLQVLAVRLDRLQRIGLVEDFQRLVCGRDR